MYWETYRIEGVLRIWAPLKSLGYLNIKKKYKCPTAIPTSSLKPLENRTKIVKSKLLKQN